MLLRQLGFSKWLPHKHPCPILKKHKKQQQNKDKHRQEGMQINIYFLFITLKKKVFIYDIIHLHLSKFKSISQLQSWMSRVLIHQHWSKEMFCNASHDHYITYPQHGHKFNDLNCPQFEHKRTTTTASLNLSTNGYKQVSPASLNLKWEHKRIWPDITC